MNSIFQMFTLTILALNFTSSIALAGQCDIEIKPNCKIRENPGQNPPSYTITYLYFNTSGQNCSYNSNTGFSSSGTLSGTNSNSIPNPILASMNQQNPGIACAFGWSGIGNIGFHVASHQDTQDLSAFPNCTNPANIQAQCGIGPLPVELMYLNATAEVNGNQNIVNLQWATASEMNNNRFEIERSNDASTFEKISEVSSLASNGMSNSVLNYNYQDSLNEVGSAPIYYRLKQIDYDGKTQYTQMVAVSFDVTSDLIRFFDSQVNSIKLQVSTAKETDIDITVYSLTGAPILEQIQRLSASSSSMIELSFNGKINVAGIYLVRAKIGSTHIIKKVMLGF